MSMEGMDVGIVQNARRRLATIEERQRTFLVTRDRPHHLTVGCVEALCSRTSAPARSS